MTEQEAIDYYSESERFKCYIDNYLRNNTNETLYSACKKLIVRFVADVYKEDSKANRTYERSE